MKAVPVPASFVTPLVYMRSSQPSHATSSYAVPVSLATPPVAVPYQPASPHRWYLRDTSQPRYSTSICTIPACLAIPLVTTRYLSGSPFYWSIRTISQLHVLHLLSRTYSYSDNVCVTPPLKAHATIQTMCVLHLLSRTMQPFRQCVLHLLSRTMQLFRQWVCYTSSQEPFNIQTMCVTPSLKKHSTHQTIRVLHIPPPPPQPCYHSFKPYSHSDNSDNVCVTPLNKHAISLGQCVCHTFFHNHATIQTMH
jgi:hypothetical protein